MRNSIKAFTLIELSITLIIISLIMAVIANGSFLVKQSKLMRVIKEINDNAIAINLFKTQYDNLPGDFPYASTIWSSVSNNGNGNGIIDNNNENYYVWQHLSAAGLITGQYNGTSDSTDQPASLYNYGSYGAGYAQANNPDNNVDNFIGNFMQYGIWTNTNLPTLPQDNVPTNCACKAILIPRDALYLDQKIDDGFANSGNILGIDGTDVTADSCSYAYNAITSTPTYNKDTNTNSCRIFKLIN